MPKQTIANRRVAVAVAIGIASHVEGGVEGVARRVEGRGKWAAAGGAARGSPSRAIRRSFGQSKSASYLCIDCGSIVVGRAYRDYAMTSGDTAQWSETIRLLGIGKGGLA